jgi:hypothetical protein
MAVPAADTPRRRDRRNGREENLVELPAGGGGGVVVEPLAVAHELHRETDVAFVSLWQTNRRPPTCGPLFGEAQPEPAARTVPRPMRSARPGSPTERRPS